VIVAPDRASYDQFGWAIAITADGTRAIIGVPNDDTPASDAGTARVFVRSGSTWIQEGVLARAAPTADSHHGYSVAIADDGSRALVGAWSASTPLGRTGSATVYVRTGSTWTEETDDDVEGAVRVLVRGPTAWTQEAVLRPAIATGMRDYFGDCVALSADGTRAIAATEVAPSSARPIRTASKEALSERPTFTRGRGVRGLRRRGSAHPRLRQTTRSDVPWPSMDQAYSPWSARPATTRPAGPPTPASRGSGPAAAAFGPRAPRFDRWSKSPTAPSATESRSAAMVRARSSARCSPRLDRAKRGAPWCSVSSPHAHRARPVGATGFARAASVWTASAATQAVVATTPPTARAAVPRSARAPTARASFAPPATRVGCRAAPATPPSSALGAARAARPIRSLHPAPYARTAPARASWTPRAPGRAPRARATRSFHRAWCVVEPPVSAMWPKRATASHRPVRSTLCAWRTRSAVLVTPSRSVISTTCAPE